MGSPALALRFFSAVTNTSGAVYLSHSPALKLRLAFLDESLDRVAMVFGLRAVHVVRHFDVQAVVNVPRRMRPGKVLLHVLISYGWPTGQAARNFPGLRGQFVRFNDPVRQAHTQRVLSADPLRQEIELSRFPRLICLGEDNTLINEDLRKQILKITRRAPFLIKSNEQEFFVDPLVSPGVVHLVGAGHVALATAQLASFADFEVVVMDDREEFASVERYPQANKVIVLDSFDDCLKHLSHTDFVVIVTRGHIHDRDVLAQALHTKAGYIGMIGSRRKREVVYQSLRENGFTEVDLGRVSSPIGLAIGADTPNEIALSIVAELVKVRSEM